MKKNFSLGIWFVIAGVFTMVATYFVTHQTMAAPDNEFVNIRVTKSTANTADHPGPATMVLLDEEGEKVQEFQVQTNIGYTEIKNIAPGNYIIKEIKVPDGYDFGTDLAITVEDTDAIQTFDFANTESDSIKLAVSMRDIAMNIFVANSQIQLLDGSNNVVDTCNTSNYSPCLFRNLNIGNYTIKETKTPPGYISIEDTTFEITSTDIGKTVEISKTRDFTKLEICKMDTNSGKQISKAVFELYDSNGDLYEKWTTDQYAKLIERIPVGKYTLKEVSAPPGYEYEKKEHEIIVNNTHEIVYIKAFNSPTIEVPNTAVNDNIIFYGIGGFLLILGIIVAAISYKKNYKK